MGVYYPSQDDMRPLRSSRDPGMQLKSFSHYMFVEIDVRGPLPAFDSWNFGTLMYEIFNGQFTNSEQLNQKGKIPQVLAQYIVICVDWKDIFTPYKRLLNPSPKLRLTVSQFLDLGSRTGSFFSTDLIKCSQSLENMSIKGDHEREIFLQYPSPDPNLRAGAY